MNLRGFLFLMILLLSCKISFASGDQWVQVSSDHFTVVTNSNEKEGRHLLDQLERMRWTFQKLFPKLNVDPDEPILVIAVKNRKSFEPLEPREALAKGNAELAGFFQRGMERNYILLRLDAEQEHPYDTIYHEYTHLLFRKYESWIPVWFNEGVAQFYQNTVIHGKDVEVGQPSVNDILFLRQNNLIPLRTLFLVDQHSPYYHEENKSNIFYAESWALTHMLLIEDNMQKTNKVIQYLIRISHHEDPIAAAEVVFGNLNKLQTQLESYIRHNDYREFLLNTTSAPLDESSYKVKSLSLTEADAIKAEFLAQVGRSDEARAILEGILKTDAGNVSACQTLAEIDMRERNTSGALKLYGEAVKHGANDPKLLSRYAYLILIAGASNENLKKAEAVLRSVIAQSPKYAPAYNQLADLLRIQPNRAEEARALELKAVDIDATNIHYRLTIANILLSEDKTDDARGVLVAAQKVATSPSDTASIDARIKEIDSLVKSREEAKAEMQRENASATADTTGPVVATDAPKHPDEPATGPKHTIDGVIHDVTCSYPYQMDLSVVSVKKKYALYSLNYMKIDYSVFNFKSTDKLDPCKTMEGLQAQVVYAESSDKTVDGQVISILLKK
jgi:tetratricopeptide (TPR) repeat protein